MPHFLKDIFLNHVGGNSKTKVFLFFIFNSTSFFFFSFFNSKEESIYTQKEEKL